MRKIFILSNTTPRHLLEPLLYQPHIIDQLCRRNVCLYIVLDSNGIDLSLCMSGIIFPKILVLMSLFLD